jgi:hypothetical protein
VAAIDLRETDQFVYIVMDLSEFELFDYIMSQDERMIERKKLGSSIGVFFFRFFFLRYSHLFRG